jgi:hypothetical protein
MLRMTILMGALIALAAPGAAMAGCAQDVDATRARLAALERTDAAGAPHESWLGEPASTMDVTKLLDGARDLARDGKEEACVKQHEQAESVLGDLENKREEQRVQRARKTEEIRDELKKKTAPQSR